MIPANNPHLYPYKPASHHSRCEDRFIDSFDMLLRSRLVTRFPLYPLLCALIRTKDAIIGSNKTCTTTAFEKSGNRLQQLITEEK